MLGKKLLRVLLPLPKLVLLEHVPGTALLYYPVHYTQVYDVPFPRYPMPVHDVELRVPEGRSNLVLHYACPDPVAHYIRTLLYSVNLPEVYPCLLYTSDAADDLLCVDLGGR